MLTMLDPFIQHARPGLTISNTVEPGQTTYDSQDPDTEFPPIEELDLSEGAPNVVVARSDDCCIGTSGVCGYISRVRFYRGAGLAPTEPGVGPDVASIANTEYTDA